MTLVLLSCNSVTDPDESGSINGTVSVEGQHVCEGIQLRLQGPTVFTETTTSNQGGYEFTGLGLGLYEVTLELQVAGLGGIHQAD